MNGMAFYIHIHTRLEADGSGGGSNGGGGSGTLVSALGREPVVGGIERRGDADEDKEDSADSGGGGGGGGSGGWSIGRKCPLLHGEAGRLSNSPLTGGNKDAELPTGTDTATEEAVAATDGVTAVADAAAAAVGVAVDVAAVVLAAVAVEDDLFFGIDPFVFDNCQHTFVRSRYFHSANPKL